MTRSISNLTNDGSEEKKNLKRGKAISTGDEIRLEKIIITIGDGGPFRDRAGQITK